MYDVNDHPKQDELNEQLGLLLAEVIKTIRHCSEKYNVDTLDLFKQFRGSLNIFIRQEKRDRRKQRIIKG